MVLGALAAALRHRTGGHLLLLACLATGGAGIARLAAVPPEPSEALPKEPVRLSLEVESATSFEEGTSVLARISDAPAQWPNLGGRRIRLFVRGAATLLPGERWLVSSVLRPERPALNWGEQDPSEERMRAGETVHGSVEAATAVRLAPAPDWRHWLESRRGELGQAARSVAPGPDAAALYLALASGERAALPGGIEEAFARSGLAHVLSVSGLHVAALALLLLVAARLLLVRALGRRAPGLELRRVAAPLCIPVVWAYVVFTGNQAPAIRSGVMATAMLAALALWRRSDALNALALAVLVIVAVEPASPFDLSLRLSFSAVLSLVLVSPAVRALFPAPAPDPSSLAPLRYRLHRLGESLLQTLCASLSVVLAGLPLVAGAFHRVSWVGLLSNVVCLPLCGVLTALAAGGAGLFVVSPLLATPVLWAGTRAAALLLAAARWFSQWPMASLPMPSLPLWAQLTFYAGLLAFALGRGRVRWLAVGTPLALVGTLAHAAVALDVPLEITFLSVGHGDAVVVTSRGHTALIDAGGVPNGADPGERIVLPFLRERGIHHLDLVILSHPHPDHALGLPAVLRAIPTDAVWLSEGSLGGPLSRAVIEAAGGARIEQVNAAHPAFALGEARLEVLGPPVDAVLLEGVNDRSVVVRVRQGQARALLTGDIEATAEEQLEPGPIALIKAPHHGSSTSSTRAFLERVHPQLAVFSVGLANRFHFPAPAVVARYQDLGARTFRTDQDGAITFVSDGFGFRPETYRAGGQN